MMAQKKLDTILENIVALTSERDSNALEIALAQTLFTLAGVKNITIHSAGNINRVKHAIDNKEKIPKSEPIPLDLVNDLATCLESSKLVNLNHKNKWLTLFPLKCAKKKPLAVIAVEENTETHDHELTIHILQIYHNFLSLMNDNERDTLTGLLNRKTFDQKINTIISGIQNPHRRKDDHDEPTFFAIFDIDHFKRVNDTYGHLIGDEVLLLFSQLMTKNFREQDLLFRFGGEEFVGIFQCPSEEIMHSVLNRFRQVIENYNFPQVGNVTVSSGFTKIDGLDLASGIMDRADVALYHAKNNGRNQVCQHEQLVKTGEIVEETSSGEIELF